MRGLDAGILAVHFIGAVWLGKRSNLARVLAFKNPSFDQGKLVILLSTLRIAFFEKSLTDGKDSFHAHVLFDKPLLSALVP